MRQLLTDFEEREQRKGIRWMFIPLLTVPASAIAILLAPGSVRYICIVAFVSHTAALVSFIKDARKFIRRIKGPEKEAFMKLYRQLHDFTAKDDMVGIVTTIQKMSKIAKGSFEETRNYVFQRGGTFLPGGSRVPLRIPSMQVCSDILDVLGADLDRLPGYLAHEWDYMREAASLRLRLLSP